MVLIGSLGEDTDVQRCLLQPPPLDVGRCLHQRDAARQMNKPGQVGQQGGEGRGSTCYYYYSLQYGVGYEYDIQDAATAAVSAAASLSYIVWDVRPQRYVPCLSSRMDWPYYHFLLLSFALFLL